VKKQPVKTWSTPVQVTESENIPCALCGGESFKPGLECEGFRYVKCTACGLVQMNPQPVKIEVARRYREISGHDYLSYELENESTFLNLQRLALKDSGFDALEKKLFEKAEDAPRFLDIGCATGALLKCLRGRGWRVTGVEISPSAEYARDKHSLDVRNLPLEENHFPPGYFDIIHASHLIEHLNDPRSFLEEIHRILKQDGRIFITTPNIGGFQSCLFKSRWRSAIFDHLYLFSAGTLNALLKTCGFTVEGVFTWGGLAAGIAPLWLKRPVDRAAKRFGFGDVMVIRAGKERL
jgi:SAM-dependent methyltransferase